MTIDKKELEKLSPQDRIKKLRLLEEERKKDVNEIERLIKESMQAIKTEKIAENIAPEPIVVDISRLFEGNGKNLEDAAKKARVTETIEYTSSGQIKYEYAKTTEEKLPVGKMGERISISDKYMMTGEEVAGMLDSGRRTSTKLKKETGL